VKGLARWCFRHRKTVLTLWLVALVGFFAIDRAAGSAFSTKFQLPNTQSFTALNLLEKEFPAVSGTSDQIVVRSTSGTVSDAPVRNRVLRMLHEVATLPHVRSVSDPFTPEGASQISRDGTIAFATVTFDEQTQALPKAAVDRVIATAQASGDHQLQVALGGGDIENAESQPGSKSTLLGVVLALIVLGLAFGALFAAFLPLITALIAIGTGYSITGLLSHVFSVASFATILGVLIGLGVGVDYALLIVTRHRTGVKGGRTIEDAAVEAGRRIDPEHFGVSIGYTRGDAPEQLRRRVAARRPGAGSSPDTTDVRDLVPDGVEGLRRLIGKFLDVGFSKFVIRPVTTPTSFREELKELADGVLDLQT